MSATSEDEYWQLSMKNVVDRMTNLFSNSRLTDCEFFVGTPPNTRKFKAHRLVIAAASPVFEAMLFRNYKEGELITVPDISPDAFYNMLDFMYTDNLHWISIENILDVRRAAEKYIFPTLERKCIDEIQKYLDKPDLRVSAIMEIYDLAKLQNLVEVSEKCLNKLQSNIASYILSDDFENVCLNVLEILKLDRVIMSEEDVFKQIIVWGRKQCCRLLMDPMNVMNIRDVVLPLLATLNFTLLTPEQFVNTVIESGILSDHESYVLLRKIIKPSSRLELPFRDVSKDCI